MVGGRDTLLGVWWEKTNHELGPLSNSKFEAWQREGKDHIPTDLRPTYRLDHFMEKDISTKALNTTVRFFQLNLTNKRKKETLYLHHNSERGKCQGLPVWRRHSFFYSL